MVSTHVIDLTSISTTDLKLRDGYLIEITICRCEM